MTRTTTALKTLSLCLAAGLALPAAAGLPAALDRVPADALLVVGIDDAAGFRDQLAGLAGRFDAPIEMDDLDELLGTAGLNRNGSVVLAVLPGAEGEPVQFDGPNANMVVVVEVQNYDAFVGGFGGTPAAGITEVEANGEQIFLKSLGGGFAAMAPRGEILEGFTGEAGHAAAFESMFGVNGVALAESTDAFVSANIQALAPMMKQGVEEMRDQLEMLAQMAGPHGAQMTQGMVFIDALAEGFLRDGRVGMAGLNIDGSGVSIDLAANFAEGSEVAGFFSAAGNTKNLLAKLPAIPYYFAGASDYSAPGLRTVFKNMAALQKQAQPDMAGMDLASMVDNSSGASAIMGVTPSIMGGMFTNTVAFYASDDAGGLLDSWKAMYAGMGAMEVEGMTMTGQYTDDAAEIAGTTVDSWAVTMTPDNNNPAAMQMRQMMAMMYGPAGGPAGYTAAVKGGVVSTFSQNQGTMALALNAAKDGNGLAIDQSILAALPADASTVAFMGVGAIGETVGGFLAMMGGGPQLNIPAGLPPIAFGASTNNGGMHGRVFIPMAVLDTAAEAAAEMNAGGQNNGGGDEGGAPRF